jgi:hypothetical protein
MRIVMIVVSIIAADSARAQGTMGVLPDPISTRELQGYADRLGLSQQQRQAIEPAHDQYREEFRVLRESQIEKFVQNSRGWQGGGFGMMNNQDEAEKNLRELESILNKIKTIDNLFFDQIQTVLTEDQVLLMASARQARDRARYRTGLSRMTGFMNPATQVDLSEIVADLKLTPAERDSIAPLLTQYESSLTNAAKKLHDTAMNSTRQTLEKLKAQGLNEASMRDQGRRGETWDKFRAIMSEANAALMEKASEVSQINRKAARSITPMLSAENSRELREQYYQRGYPEAASRGNSTRRAFEAALKFEDLSDDQRQTITAMAAEFEASSDRVTEQMLDMIDENRQKQSFFDFDMDRRRKHEEQLRELREKRTAAGQTAMDSLKAMLGPDLTAKLEQRVAEAPASEAGAQGTSTVRFGPGGPGGTAIVAEVRTETAPADELAVVDRFVPGPITKRDVDLFAEALKLSNDDKSVLASLYDNYIAEFKVLEENQIKAIRDAQQKLWSFNREAGDVAPPGPEAVDQLYALRRAALQAIIALDRSLLDDIQITLLSDDSRPQVQRLEQSRLRQIYARAADDSFGRGGGSQRFGRMFGQNSESPVDLTAVMRELTLTPTDPAAFQTAIGEYEQSVTESFAKMYESAMKMQQGSDKFRAQMVSSERERGDNAEGRARRFEGGDGMRQAMEGDSRAAREARQAITALNRASLDKVKQALPEAQAHELQQSYNRKAFAGVYRDNRSAERHLNAAMALEDLTSQQRAQVQEIVAEFRAEYEAISEKLVELEIHRPDAAGNQENRDWRGMGDQMRNREKLQFDRNDVNDKAVSKLRAALTEDQVARLGGLEIEDQSPQTRPRMGR